jgi:hypothetical protein
MKTAKFKVGQKVTTVGYRFHLPLREYTVQAAGLGYISIEGEEGLWWANAFKAATPVKSQTLIRSAKGRFVSPAISKLRNGSIYRTPQGVGRLLGVVGKKQRLAVIVTEHGTKTVKPEELRKVDKEVVRHFLALKN